MKSFNDHVKETANEMFEFQKAEPRSGSGNKDGDPTPPAVPPKDNDEYVQKMREAKTPEERIQIMKSYVKT